MSHPALTVTQHRPWPLPATPWAITMDWTGLLFLHWRVEPHALQRLLPNGVEVETFDGSAWIGVVPFRMERTRARCLPAVPTAHSFLELNVRTYVRCGARSGVWFFSLDAESRLAVEGARIAFGLPYLMARMQCVQRGDACDYESVRTDARAPRAAFRARWNVCGAFTSARAETLEHFLTARYCLFSVRRGALLCGDIAHAPWQLAPVSLDLNECSMTRALGIELSGCPDHALAAADLTVAAWTPRRVRTIDRPFTGTVRSMQVSGT